MPVPVLLVLLVCAGLVAAVPRVGAGAAGDGGGGGGLAAGGGVWCGMLMAASAARTYRCAASSSAGTFLRPQHLVHFPALDILYQQTK